jgi:hypothetical protein
MPSLDYRHDFARPVLLGEDGKLVPLAMDLMKDAKPSLEWTKHTLNPTGIIELGVQTWLVREPKENKPEPSTLAAPGKCSVQFKGLPLKGRDVYDTGIITTLEVSRD